MEKVCKWCSNYNNGKCSILNKKLYIDEPGIYDEILEKINRFFNKNFRLYLDPYNLKNLAEELTEEMEYFVQIDVGFNKVIKNTNIEEEFSCNYWR